MMMKINGWKVISAKVNFFGKFFFYIGRGFNEFCLIFGRLFLL